MKINPSNINLTSSTDGEFSTIKDNLEYISIYKNNVLKDLIIYQIDNNSDKRILSKTSYENFNIKSIEMYNSSGSIIYVQSKSNINNNEINEYISKDLQHKYPPDKQSDLDYLLNAGMFSLCIYTIILLCDKFSNLCNTN